MFGPRNVWFHCCELFVMLDWMIVHVTFNMIDLIGCNDLQPWSTEYRKYVNTYTHI